MNVGVKLRPSRAKSTEDPGHMGIYWRHDDRRHFRGYYFHIDDLPSECQEPSKWRDHLFDNTVPGYIVEDIKIQDDFKNRRESLVRKSWAAEEALAEYLEEVTRPRQHGAYSFNPDTFNCHNCVTWAVETINLALGEVLSRVRQGRIKLMKAQLEAMP